MSTIEVEVDLEDYEEDIKEFFCNQNCLLNMPFGKLKELVNNMYKNLYVYSENKLTVEDIYNDLDRILKESEIN